MVWKIERTEPLLTLPLSGQAAIPVQNRGSIFQPTVLPRQRFFLDSGRDEDSRIDADQCTGHVDDVQYAAPGAFLRSSIVQSRQLQSCGSPQMKYQIGSK